MAAGDWTWYGVGPNVDLSSGSYKIMLTASTHTPNQDTHDFRDDLTNEHLYKVLGGAASADPLIAYIAYASDQSVSNGTLTIDNAAVTLKGTVAA
jgi:hypothetical protein